MKITFELESEQKVLIKSGDKVIGHVFTPAGSGRNVLNAVQVCGFEEAYTLWGCGVFGEATFREWTTPTGDVYTTLVKFQAKKDIQLRFSEYENKPYNQIHHSFRSSCARCYSVPCACHELRVKDEHGNVEHRLEYKDGERSVWASNPNKEVSLGQQSDASTRKYSVEELEKIEEKFLSYIRGLHGRNKITGMMTMTTWMTTFPDKVREILAEAKT